MSEKGKTSGIAAAVAVFFLLFAYLCGIAYKESRQESAREWTSKVDVSYRWDDIDPLDTIRYESFDYRFNTNDKVDSIEVRIYKWEGDILTGDYYVYGEIAGLDSANKKVWSRDFKELMFRSPGLRPGEIAFATSTKRER